MQRVESENVTLNLPVLEQLSHTGMHLCLVTFMQGGGNLVSQQVEQFQRLRFFLFGEEKKSGVKKRSLRRNQEALREA